jgi:hypothetical protein
VTTPADSQAAIAYLRSTAAIRERCGLVFAAAEADKAPHFILHAGRLPETARYVATVIRENYPTLKIPYHSRWRHFAAGGRDRWVALASRLKDRSPAEVARIRFDLAVTSVLLDAGAGEAWGYREPSSGQRFSRSEGLAVASFDLFAAGAFSSDRQDPLRADAAALQTFSERTLVAGFQVTDGNPLVGLGGRVALLRRLGGALAADPELFGPAGRIGHLFDYLQGRAQGSLPATEILDAVLRGFSSIWPGRETIDGVNLGDVWRHSAIRAAGPTNGLVPFHKLSQWLSYSLVEPLEDTGVVVTGLDRLTGLPEYRNGGLFIDSEVLVPRDRALLTSLHAVGAEPIVEWRALTVVLLDRIADLVRAELRLTAADFLLAKILEGGTWSAGRRLARERRPDGSSPIRLDSDGTVF